jgi:hypothetical protein
MTTTQYMWTYVNKCFVLYISYVGSYLILQKGGDMEKGQITATRVRRFKDLMSRKL